MKQVIIRIVAPAVPVYDVLAGIIRNGQFEPTSSVDLFLSDLSLDLSDVITQSALLGGSAYVTQDNLDRLFGALSSTCDSVQYFGNFITFNYETKEENKD
uniref:Uncharacterized protein n=1 Tax=Dulem virus 212 TaxID=3145689 RepID=A0AAU8B7G7_9VIRU